MPKVVRDEGLEERVRVFIRQRGTIASAASALGVDRTFLWRFQRSGCAIGRTRGRLSDALMRFEKATSLAESVTNASPMPLPLGVSPDDLKAMRAFFQNMVNVIDAYAATPSLAPSAVELTDLVAGATTVHSDGMPLEGG